MHNSAPYTLVKYVTIAATKLHLSSEGMKDLN